ncbi:hypothetical protein ACSS6W_003169 [Trichoderma asperelloides]
MAKWGLAWQQMGIRGNETKGRAFIQHELRRSYYYYYFYYYYYYYYYYFTV